VEPAAAGAAPRSDFFADEEEDTNVLFAEDARDVDIAAI
jgi:hypothetical protein